MHRSYSSILLRRLTVGFVCVAGLLLCGLYASRLPAAHAQELPQSTPTIVPKDSLPAGFSVLAAATLATDAYEPDGTSGQASTLTDGVTQLHSIYPIGDQDWVKFQLATSGSVLLQTSGDPLGNVAMSLYDSTLTTPIASIQGCTIQALSAGTYYVQVEEQGNDAAVASYNIGYKSSYDSHEPDCTSGQAASINNGDIQTHSIDLVGDQDWVTFQLGGTSSITLETGGSHPTTDDTEMWLYNSSLQQIDYSDDKNPNVLYSYIQRCGSTALPPGTYYAKIGKRLNDAQIASYTLTFKINSACIPNTRVTTGGVLRGSYWVRPSGSTVQSYAGLNSGPARLITIDGVTPLISSTGISLKKTAGYESYSEFIGVPGSRLKNTYYFPWYNNLSTSQFTSQLCFANLGAGNSTITVTIGGTNRGSYTVASNRGKCVTYNISAGPVRVKSGNGYPIVASLSTNMKNNATYTSYSEFLGLSANNTYSTFTDYVFPIYSNASTSSYFSQLRFTNVGGASTKVTVKIAGVLRGTYTLLPNQSKLVPYSNVNNGVVHVQSSGAPIVASMSVQLKSTSSYASYSESLGLPEAALTETRFVFPWYNNLTRGSLASQLRITNIGKTSTNVTVTIAGNTKGSISLGPLQSKVVSYANLDGGPIVVQSSGGVPILASLGTYMKKGFGFTSYSEFIGQLGFPGNQLATYSWFPWYSNASTGNFVSQLRFAIP